MEKLPDVCGTTAHGFERCRDAFAANFRNGEEIGAACSIRVDGVTVVDLWGGTADPDTNAAWQRDTIVPVFSVSKGVAAVCLLHLVAQGRLNLDAPMTRYWPEFAQGGKGEISVRDTLAHRAGVPFLDGAVDFPELGDVRHMAARVAAQMPVFEPGSAHLYHPVTIGWIVSELVRQITGSTLSEWAQENVGSRLGIALFFGLPEAERCRVARLVHRDPGQVDVALATTMPPGSLAWKALTLNGLLSFGPHLGEGSLNDARLQAAELAGAALVTNARSLATFYAACLAPVDGVRLLSDDVIADAILPVSNGRQFGLDDDGPAWGAGVMTPWSVQPMLGGSSFGHDGMGGSLAFASPEHNVAFAYVRNGLAPGGVEDPEVYGVVKALKTILLEGNAA